MARFRFPATARANLILKLAGSQRADSATSFTVVSPTEIQGSATSGNFCGAGKSYTVYFDMQFSQPFTASASYAAAGGPGRTGPGAAALTFDASRGRPLVAKVGISYVSAANAGLNLAAESPGWSFAAARQRAHAAWNAVLRRVAVGGGSAAAAGRLLHRAVPLAAGPERVQRRQRPVPGHRRHGPHRGPGPPRLLHELLGLGHLPGPGAAGGAGRPGRRQRRRPVDDRRLRPGRHAAQVDRGQRRDLRHGRRPRRRRPGRLLRVRRPGLRHRDRPGRHDRRGDRARPHPARAERSHPARLPGRRRPVRLLQLLRAGVHHAGVRHRRLRDLGPGRRPRPGRGRRAVPPPRPGLGATS